MKIEKWGVLKTHESENTKKSWFSIFWFMPAVNKSDAVLSIARQRKIAKATVADTYDIIYAKANRHRSSKRGIYYTFLICPKPLSNALFVFPKKHRKVAKEMISEIEMPV